MFVKIKHNKQIRDTLYYHEKKEKLKLAECLAAVNFVKDLEYLTHEDKLHHFRQLTSLHESITDNCLHISLNFHPFDKLSNQEMVQIAGRYVQEMRFGDQPYLIYRHFDTIHPHMHLVTTKIQPDGESLDLSKRDYFQSLAITRRIEGDHHLVQSGQWQRQQQTIVHALTIKYGEMATMTALNNVLHKVMSQYKHTSLEEFNAVLRLYNVEAYRGKEDSQLYHHKGLVYRLLNDNGRPVGTPIKASLFEHKPTLQHLETLWKSNQVEVQRTQHRQRVTNTLDWNMAKNNMDLPALKRELERQRISMVWMDGREGRQQQLFYVDHETRAVFEGSKLGERYDALALRQRLVMTQTQEEKQVQKHRQRHHHSIIHDL